MPGRWELRVNRLGVHETPRQTRTYGSYEVLIDGARVPDLSGFVCESRGPSANAPAGNGRRIEAKEYPLWTQFGAYRSIGYSIAEVPGQAPMPAIALAKTGARTGILIHPAHPPKLFLSSIGCLNLTGALAPTQNMDFFDSRRRVIAMLESLKSFAPAAFSHEVMTPITGAVVVIAGDPMNVIAPVRAEGFVEVLAAEPRSLPISKGAAIQATRWMLANFGQQLSLAVTGKPYGVEHLCGIVCQETAYKWVPWIGRLSPQQIVERSVFDASGDSAGTSRGAFPRNTGEFRARYGDEFADMLINEANLTRRLQNYADKQWVYKGYGLFQYDLQHVVTDRAFFAERQWYRFDDCLRKVIQELDLKYRATRDLWEAIRAYNGSGPRARQYRENVRVFTEYAREVIRGG